MSLDVRSTVEKLEPLDLSKCNTVGELVAAMSKCSFGARMLGEVAATLTLWIQSGQIPTVVYGGYDDSRVGFLLESMWERDWFRDLLTPGEFPGETQPDAPVLVIGDLEERNTQAIFRHTGRTIFINAHGIVRPGQIRDGYFPDAVFSDPRFIVPLLSAVLRERIDGEPMSVTEFFMQFGNDGGLASEVVEGARVVRTMVEDPDCTVFLTLSGAMTIAKMGLVVCDMIDRGMVQAVTSTGALMAHGLIEGMGLHHYKYRPEHSDELLAEQKINRVTDTLEPEENFTDAADVMDSVLRSLVHTGPIGPSLIHRGIGQHLVKSSPESRAILASAFRRDVPVFVPAFVDSEIGNDVYVHNLQRQRDGRLRITVDPSLDSERLVEMATSAKKIGIFSIGGGVPRNNVQNVAPLLEITNERLGLDLPERMFSYGCRIAPDPMWLGHLSGCTYSENASWRKMDMVNGLFAEIHADATIVLPFVVKHVMESTA